MTRRKALRWARNIVLTLLLIFGCPGALLISADLACSYSIDLWLPLYPGAEVVSSDYNWIRPRASGRTIMVFKSSDEAETVRQFYRDVIIRLMGEAASRGSASTNWNVEEDPNGGSVITLVSVCGNY